MTKDEALKLALEAAYLAGFNDSGEGYNGEYPFRDHCASPLKDHHWILRRDEYIQKALAQPEQEPVEPDGWLYSLIVEGQVVNEKFTSVNWDTRYEPFGRRGVDHGGKVTKTPLYTTPPQRKPLTDEEIDKLPWEPHEGNPMTFAEGLRYFARAIEAAHGIKE